MTTPAKRTEFFFDEIFELASVRIVATRTRHAFKGFMCGFFKQLLSHVGMAFKTLLKNRPIGLGCSAHLSTHCAGQQNSEHYVSYQLSMHVV
jgi:hypothetical protein